MFEQFTNTLTIDRVTTIPSKSLFKFRSVQIKYSPVCGSHTHFNAPQEYDVAYNVFVLTFTVLNYFELFTADSGTKGLA